MKHSKKPKSVKTRLKIPSKNKKKPPIPKSPTLKDWQSLAERRLNKLLPLAREFPEVLKEGPRADWSATITLVGRPKMRILNQKYRGKHYATDVLSFPTGEPFRSTGLLGDLVICLPTLKENARTQKHAARLELEVLLVHGLLHLLGFDHEKGEDEYLRMRAWETQILSKSVGKTKAQAISLIFRTGT